MSNRTKNIVYSVVLLSLMYFVYAWRKHNNPPVKQQQSIEGSTMGTTYHIKYLDNRNFKSEIDSLLVVFNQSLSTYIPDSEISTFNKTAKLRFKSPYFYPMLEKSKEVYQNTSGAFDPTVMPLVNAWGFGPEKSNNPDSATVERLRKLVNYDSIFFDKESVCKLMPGQMLDFSAIAKGYGVDVVADYLKEKGVKNYMVEIGGEVVCRGANQKGDIWRIGIDNPDMAANSDQAIQAVVKLKDKALATSGNYRNFYEKDGKKYSHTLNPVTGYPVSHTLLSASVFADDCMTADAYATAFMVMGKDKSVELARKLGIDIFLVYEEKGEIKTYMSDKLKDSFEAVK